MDKAHQLAIGHGPSTWTGYPLPNVGTNQIALLGVSEPLPQEPSIASWPNSDTNAACGPPPGGTAPLSERDDQLVVDLGELDDPARELAGDQVAVGR